MRSDKLLESTQKILQGKLVEENIKDKFSNEFFKILKLNNLYIYDEEPDKLIITNSAARNLCGSMYLDNTSEITTFEATVLPCVNMSCVSLALPPFSKTQFNSFTLVTI